MAGTQRGRRELSKGQTTMMMMINCYPGRERERERRKALNKQYVFRERDRGTEGETRH